MTDTADERMFTEEELNQRVAVEVAKQRLHDVERSLGQIRVDTETKYASIQAGIEGIGDQFDRMYKHIDERTKETRTEMERDFATKPEMLVLEGKVDKLAFRVTTIVTIALVVVQGAFKIWDNMDNSRGASYPQQYQQPQQGRSNP